ncbi:sulfotransferase [Parasedimentitalea marina]|nr:sulfotransferase [Parasedimentitalea marina]
MTIAISMTAVVVFGICFGLTGIAGVAHQVMLTTSAGLSAMMNPEIDDSAKEIAVRRAGLSLIRAAFGIFWRFAFALGAAAAPIYAASGLGLVSSADVFTVMFRLDYIVGVSAVMILATALLRPSNSSTDNMSVSKNQYSATDRFFHELAFSSPAILKGVSWIEDNTMARSVPEAVDAPIFITSLARGGTTAMLNALSDIPGTATHIFRDMPFLTAPVLWHRLSGGDKRTVQRHQRAHGDGLEIDLDTPEAFEEVAWKMGWPEKYTARGIDLWRSSDHNPRSERFLRHHMAKITYARRLQGRIKGASKVHYLSKNNANIARLGFLLETFPDCKIVVPVRRPECHAASLLRQHCNFLKKHREDDFIRHYMRDIGHFEFGAIHRPILFEDFVPGHFDPANSNYWMNYWIHTFRHVLEHRDKLALVLQDDLRATPMATMNGLCEKLDLESYGVNFHRYFHRDPDVANIEGFDPQIFENACDIYHRIARFAVN